MSGAMAAAGCLPPYWMVTVDRVPASGAGRAVAVSTESSHCTAQPLPRDLGGLFLPPPALQAQLSPEALPPQTPEHLSGCIPFPSEPDHGQPRKGPLTCGSHAWEHPTVAVVRLPQPSRGPRVEQGCAHPLPHWCSAHPYPQLSLK